MHRSLFGDQFHYVSNTRSVYYKGVKTISKKKTYTYGKELIKETCERDVFVQHVPSDGDSVEYEWFKFQVWYKGVMLHIRVMSHVWHGWVMALIQRLGIHDSQALCMYTCNMTHPYHTCDVTLIYLTVQLQRFIGNVTHSYVSHCKWYRVIIRNVMKYHSQCDTYE